MIITGVRVGAETNSSSSHSFVIIPGIERVVDNLDNIVLIGHSVFSTALVKDSEIVGFLVTLFNSIVKLDKNKYEQLKKELGVKKLLTHYSGKIGERLVVDIEKIDFDIKEMIDHDLPMVKFGDENAESTQHKFNFLIELLKGALKDKRLIVILEGESSGGLEPHEVFILTTGEVATSYEYHPLEKILKNQILLTKPGNYYNLFILSKPPVKLRFVENLNNIKPEYPESIDLKITNKCLNKCPYCHENSTPDGKHADFGLFKELINQIKGKTLEVAIGGGNPALHPNLRDMVKYSLENGVMVGVTMLDVDFMKSFPVLNYEDRVKIYPAYGISASSFSTIKKVFNIISKNYILGSDFVIHFINRVHSQSFVERVLDYYLDNVEDYIKDDIGFLILGYKDVGRGKVFTNLHDDLDIRSIINEYSGKVRLSFDNLAIQQLKLKKHIPKKVWDKFYMGDDGEYTMYIDLVEKKYSKSSYSNEVFSFEELNVKEMFRKIH